MPKSSTTTLLINANPKHNSFCDGIIKTIQSQLELKNASYQTFQLSEMQFSIDLPFGYSVPPQMEPDLLEFTQALKDATHIVIVTPVWWGGLPAKFKGLIDRVLLPGIGFRFEKGSSLPTPLLKGKQAKLIFTLDTPVFYFKWWQKAPAVNELEKTILNFCGVKVTKKLFFSPIVKSDEMLRDKWLAKVKRHF